MVRKILVAVDGSAVSESVLPTLEALLRLQDADVTLVTVLRESTLTRNRRAGEYLERLAGGLRRKGGVVSTQVLVGKPAPVLVDYSVRKGVDLVLLCSKGRSGVQRALLGSVAEEILRRSPVPVLVVRPLPKGAAMEGIRRIIVPLDGSHRSGSILPHLEPLAKATGARIIFATVVEPGSKTGLPVELVAKNLFKEQKRLHRQGIPTEICIRFGDPAQEILALGDAQDADLIALSTHGRTGLDRLLYGSVAESVLRNGTLPLLMIRTAGIFVPDPLHVTEIRARRRRQRQEVQPAGSA